MYDYIKCNKCGKSPFKDDGGLVNYDDPHLGDLKALCSECAEDYTLVRFKKIDDSPDNSKWVKYPEYMREIIKGPLNKNYLSDKEAIEEDKNRILEECEVHRCGDENAVFIYHKPTCISFVCHDYPTFEENKEGALKRLQDILCTKMLEILGKNEK